MSCKKKTTDYSDDALLEQLRSLPEMQVPDGLKDGIMARIAPKRINPVTRLLRVINTPFTLSIRPIYAFATVLLIGSSFMLGRLSLDTQILSPVSLAATDNQLIEKASNAKSAYLLGRGLLAAQKENLAIGLLQKASLLEPDNPEYAYWEGVGHWFNNEPDMERSSYMRGLTAAPQSIPLLTNLGHSYLGEGKYEQALSTYQDVLEISPAEHDALYNQGLIFRKLGDKNKEIDAWKSYLQVYRTGKSAFRAVVRLNDYGDFSYRTYVIGARKVILSPDIVFDARSPETSLQELLPIISILQANNHMQLEIVVFSEKNLEKARMRAMAIKNILHQEAGPDITARVAFSWFDSPEIIHTTQSESHTLKNSLLLFSTINATQNNTEVSI